MAIYTSYDNPGTQFAVSSSRPDNAIGIVLPLGKSEDGVFFKQSFTTLDAAKSNIKNLILTMRGERLMHPTLGSSIWNVIMEPMQDDTFQESINVTIRETVKTWIPYINIDTLDITTNDENNSVEIAMTISLKNDPQTSSTLYLSISKGDI